MRRTLVTGYPVYALDQPVPIIITTKCPEKWLLLDCEGGKIYVGRMVESSHGHRFQDATDEQLRAALKVIVDEFKARSRTLDINATLKTFTFDSVAVEKKVLKRFATLKKKGHGNSLKMPPC